MVLSFWAIICDAELVLRERRVCDHLLAAPRTSPLMRSMIAAALAPENRVRTLSTASVLRVMARFLSLRRFDPLKPIHIGTQRFRNHDAAVCLLIVLK